MENINPRIIKKIWESSYDKNIKDFLISVIREEYGHPEQEHWHYSDVYDKEINKYSSK